MTSRRVLLVCRASLWSEGIQRILSRLEAVEVLGPVEPDDATHERLSDTPDLVVIIDRDEGRELEDSLTSRRLIEHPDLPVVRISDELRLYISKTLPTSISSLAEYVAQMPPRPDPSAQARPSTAPERGFQPFDPTIGS